MGINENLRELLERISKESPTGRDMDQYFLYVKQLFEKNRLKRERLPNERKARTAKLVIAGGDPTNGDFDLYVTLGYYPDGRLAELFCKAGKQGGMIGALLDATAMAISVGLQYGIPFEVFAGKMARQRFAPQGLTEDKDEDLKMVSSPLDYLARWALKRTKLPVDRTG